MTEYEDPFVELRQVDDPSADDITHVVTSYGTWESLQTSAQTCVYCRLVAKAVAASLWYSEVKPKSEIITMIGNTHESDRVMFRHISHDHKLRHHEELLLLARSDVSCIRPVYVSWFPEGGPRVASSKTGYRARLPTSYACLRRLSPPCRKPHEIYILL